MFCQSEIEIILFDIVTIKSKKGQYDTSHFVKRSMQDQAFICQAAGHLNLKIISVAVLEISHEFSATCLLYPQISIKFHLSGVDSIAVVTENPLTSQILHCIQDLFCAVPLFY